MGAMNQSRLTYSYAPKSIPAGIIFNQLTLDEDPLVTASNYETLDQLGIPIWGRIHYNSLDIKNLVSFMTQWLSDRVEQELDHKRKTASLRTLKFFLMRN